MSFVATASEILEFSGIPRRTDESELGFQRVSDDRRVEQAKQFFETSINQSPTAIVLGIHCPVTEEDRVVRLDFHEDEQRSYRRCTLIIEEGTWSGDTFQQAATVLRAIEGRIASEPDEPEEADEEAYAVDQDGETDPIRESLAGDFAPNSDIESENLQDIEIGRSQLNSLAFKLGNPDWLARNADVVRDLAKPATVIDGQHRLLGAVRIEYREIPFTAVALFDCNWAEQVFQFTVVNYSAKRIPDQFITANAALSLTGSELETLRSRLEQAKVKVVEYELMRYVNFDPLSPFYQLVNLTERQDPSLLGYKTMVKIAKVWYKASHKAIPKLIQRLYPDLENTGARANEQRMMRWKEEDWARLFLIFWQEVKDCYDPQGVWLENNLKLTAVLELLQEVILDTINTTNPQLYTVDDSRDAFDKIASFLRGQARLITGYIPGRFFHLEWATKSINVGPGRKLLKDALVVLINDEGKSRYAKFKLVQG